VGQLSGGFAVARSKRLSSGLKGKALGVEGESEVLGRREIGRTERERKKGGAK